MAIGTSFVITKKGLNDAADRLGFEGEGYAYLKTPLWWAGILTLVVGEIANFAAYAFAPAILVTPLGALSVLIGAVLGAYFLEEELGTLGRLGCAICLIGSVVIVLHAPPDKEIATVDEILHYAIQPGAYGDASHDTAIADCGRVCHLLFGGDRLLISYDLQSCTSLRQEKSHNLHIYLLDSRLRFGHVGQGFRYRLEALDGRKQSIHPSLDLRVRHHHGGLHPDTNELFQQSAQPVLDFNRQPAILRHIHNRHSLCVVHSLPRLQHL